MDKVFGTVGVLGLLATALYAKFQPSRTANAKDHDRTVLVLGFLTCIAGAFTALSAVYKNEMPTVVFGVAIECISFFPLVDRIKKCAHLPNNSKPLVVYEDGALILYPPCEEF